ncbi:hormonally up-regulated neu tumor-associated kinase homolog A-like isoform X2 [Ptychodera flava]|uniref:hormonally up-regulated neu tumor-associated kinase homolog A-like isoform X2 n=1 Tax=Ptychodera flava TaxID=63121 RepID=UPI00396A0E5B
MGRLQYIGRYIIDGRPLGKGNFATVELATHSITRSKVAIKVIDTKKIKEDYVRQNLHREARILAQVRHPNIIRLYETIRSSTLYCLVTEFAGGGQLLEFVRGHKDGRLTEKTARPFVRQLVSALHHLHERGIVHRDLKMENIILDEKKKNLKIVDFGLSNTFRRDAMLQTHCGSPEYAAPELFVMGTKYGSEVDIWSLGINMYAMVVGKLPFTTPFSEPQRRQKLLQQIQYGITAVHESDMTHLSPECRDLLHHCIEPNPHLRIPILDIEIHSWITDNGKEGFFSYQPPPKDREAKKQITDRMSELLKVPIDRIESNVHQYRCDDVSAMYNLLMDEHLKCKGLWDIDHTAKKEYKRLYLKDKDKEKAKNDGKNNGKTSEEDGKDSMKQKAPTPVMLTKPSLYDPDYRIRRKSSSASSYSSSTKQSGHTRTASSVSGRTRPGTSQSPYSSLSSPSNRVTEHNEDTKSANAEAAEDTGEPIRNCDTDKDKSGKKEEEVPKLSIINMETFLTEGFKTRTVVNTNFPSGSLSPCGTSRSESARSSHFEEVYKRYVHAEDKAKTKQASKAAEKKTEFLEEILRSEDCDNDVQENDEKDTKDAGKAEAEDSGNDCGSEANAIDTNEDAVNITEADLDKNVRRDSDDLNNNDEMKDEEKVINNNLKDVSSEYGSDSGKENRIVKWVQQTQMETEFDCSIPTSPVIETPAKAFQTPVSPASRDLFPSRQSQKSAQSKCSTRSAPKPTPWKQQYNVTRTTTIPEPAVRESLKEKGHRQSRTFQGSVYSPRPDMRRLHAGRTPIRGEGCTSQCLKMVSDFTPALPQTPVDLKHPTPVPGRTTSRKL